MKNFILLAPLIVGMVSCRLNMNPEDDIIQRRDRIKQKEEVDGIESGSVHSEMKKLLSRSKYRKNLYYFVD